MCWHHKVSVLILWYFLRPHPARGRRHDDSGSVCRTSSASPTRRFTRRKPETETPHEHEHTRPKWIRGTAARFLTKNNNPDDFLLAQITFIHQRGCGGRPQHSAGLTVCSTDSWSGNWMLWFSVQFTYSLISRVGSLPPLWRTSNCRQTTHFIESELNLFITPWPPEPAGTTTYSCSTGKTNGPGWPPFPPLFA